MRKLISVCCVSLVAASICAAATPKEIEAAVQKGAAYLKQHYDGAKPGKLAEGSEGVGPAALAGLALLEAGTSPDDAVVRNITAGIRDAAFTEHRTYHLTLCILFLDRLGEPSDAPLIQLCAVRLLAGQNANGGWTYNCVPEVPAAEERTLRAALMVAELKANGKNPPPVVGKQPNPANQPNQPRPAVVARLHPEVEKYAAKLTTVRDRNNHDDNSNTQFGILGVWVARKHGVPTETALDRIEKRFLATQTNTGGWPYSGHAQGSPSMTCAGLLGLATAVGLREERRLKAEGVRRPDPAPKGDPAKPAAKSDDPFFNPPPVPKSDDPFFNPPKPAPKDAPKPKEAPKAPLDARDLAVQKGLAALGAVLAGDVPAAGKGKGKNRVLVGGTLGDRDFYFLWSLERVGVVFGLDKIGNIDWYEFGAEELLAEQHPNGAWGKGRGSVVDTSFAVLFLSRSNFVRDLSARVQGKLSNTELRAGRPASEPVPEVAPAPAPMPKLNPAPGSGPVVISPKPMPMPVPVEDPSARLDHKALAADLVAAPDSEWDAALARVRDGKGAAFTQALVLALTRLDGERRKAARAALAERLTRMNADTLRTMAKADEPELRRGAVLAMAMKDDSAHLPDLVAALADTEEFVVRAARAGLKSVTGEDFGPAPDATPAERAAVIRAWGQWLRKQK